MVPGSSAVKHWPDSFDYIARCLVAQWRGLGEYERAILDDEWGGTMPPSVPVHFYEAILWRVERRDRSRTFSIPLISMKEG